MIAVDCHVHIYRNFNLDLFFRNAFLNFHLVLKGKAATKLLLLTEKEGSNFFESNLTSSNEFDISRVDNGELIRVFDKKLNDELFVAPGFQMATIEKIEAHGLFLKKRIPDSLTAKETLQRIKDEGAIAGIPWSLGKWTGERKRIVKELISEFGTSIFIGDSALRPVLLPDSDIFKLARVSGLKVLTGSDPLPLKGEERRVGSCITVFFETSPEKGHLSQAFKEVVIGGKKYAHLGSHCSFLNILKKNLELRIY